MSYGLLVMAGTWGWGVHGTPRLCSVYRRDVEEVSPAELLLDLVRVLAED